jgi:hypothetical protein
MRIIQVDYTSSLAVIFPVLAWVLYVFLALTRSSGRADFVYAGAAITVCGLLVLLARYRVFQTVFGHGDEVAGVVSAVAFLFDRGQVTATYESGGEEHLCVNAVQKTKRTQSLQVGAYVTVVFDPSNPKRAFIRDLYL